MNFIAISKHDCCQIPVNELIYGDEIQRISPHTTLLEQVTHEIIGTSRYRNGARPTPEHEVTLRAVVRSAIDAGDPVPVLVPFGASKQGEFGVDLAEVMALRQLICLNQRVTLFYKPGITINIRLEDATDGVLFDTNWYNQKTISYCERFEQLANVMMPDVNVIRESSRADYTGAHFHRTKEVLFDAIHFQNDAMLESIGWVNGLPLEQLEHYRKVHRRFYNLSAHESDEQLARFFACAICRRIQEATCEPVTGNSIILYFGNPVPGTEQARRVYYMTNVKQHTHRAPWLGKGHICMHQYAGHVAGWDGDGLAYEENHLTLKNGDRRVTVEADYVSSE